MRSGPLQSTDWGDMWTRQPASPPGETVRGIVRLGLSAERINGVHPGTNAPREAACSSSFNERDVTAKLVAECVGQKGGLGEEIVGAGIDCQRDCLLTQVDSD